LPETIQNLPEIRKLPFKATSEHANLGAALLIRNQGDEREHDFFAFILHCGRSFFIDVDTAEPESTPTRGDGCCCGESPPDGHCGS